MQSLNTEPDTDTILFKGTREESEAFLVDELERKYGHGHFNIPLHTLGGRQFWGDEFVHAGWRIQKNIFTDHYRLLDPNDVRQAWGDFEGTRSYYELLRRKQDIKHQHRHAVVLVHGIFRSRHSLDKIKTSLQEHEFEPISIDYPSTRRSLKEHADQLNTVLNRLPESDTVSFVTHSMGGLVVRKALGTNPEWKNCLETGRIVMIAPPNRGSEVANKLQSFWPYQFLSGPAGENLTDTAVRSLPIPKEEFGVIAGEISGPGFFDFLLEGPTDGTVEQSSTKLKTMKDFVTVKGMHSFVMNNPETIDHVICFLETGRFCRDE